MKKTAQTQNIPWVVFLFSIILVLISFVPVVFPAIIQSSDITTTLNISKVGPDQYEVGSLAMPLIIINIIVFSIFVIYKKNKLPKFIESYLKKLTNYEISKKTSFIVLLVILGIYIIFTVSELGVEEKWDDYQGIKIRLSWWNLDQIMSSFEPHGTYFLLKASDILFGNYKVIPFLASIALLLITYFLTKKITQKRFAAIITVLVLLQSNLFLTYDTSVTYSNFWILFYLLSLYLVYKFWPLSPISYLISISAKALTIVFLPMSIYFVLRSGVSKKNKIIIISPIIVIIVVVGIAAMSDSDGDTTYETFKSKEFWMGFSSFSYQLRSDVLILLFMIPLMIGLFILSKYGVKHAESIMVLISGMLLISPILTGFTNQTNQPYRFMPLVVFFAIGVGMLLSKRTESAKY